MRTTKPISTVSFNTDEYLELKLRELQKAKIISFWAFIHHLPEDDEGGKKHHCHVYMEPSKMLQTDDVKEHFWEYDPENPNKPLGCISFRASKFDDWYLYAIHDPAYLARKGMSRKYHYKHEDVKSSDPDDLLYRVRMINRVAVSPYSAMQEAIQNGLTWQEYFSRGTVPIPQIRQFEAAWYMLLNHTTNRAGRENHPMEAEFEPQRGTLADRAQQLMDITRKQGEQRLYETAELTPIDPDEELPF